MEQKIYTVEGRRLLLPLDDVELAKVYIGPTLSKYTTCSSRRLAAVKELRRDGGSSLPYAVDIVWAAYEELRKEGKL